MICSACGKVCAWLERHHKFHNVKWARELYGNLMNHPLNIQRVCNGCNGSHAGLGLIHWNETQFCNALGIEQRSKVKI